MKITISFGSRFLFIFAIFFFATYPAHAGRYEIVKGKGVEVCEAYKKNLESFNDPLPMVCERKINPAFSEFEKPVWQSVNVGQGEGRVLLHRILNYQHAGEYDQFRKNLYRDSDLNGFIKEYESSRTPILRRAKIDIDNDGRADDVAIFRNGYCPETSVAPHFAANIYLLKAGLEPNEPMIDASYPAERLLRGNINPNQGEFAPSDLFRYKEKSYIDKYCAFRNRFTGCDEADNLIVFKINVDAATEICRYKYHNH